MDYDNCTIAVVVGERRRKILIVSSELNDDTPTRMFSGFDNRTIEYTDLNARQVYSLVKDAWYAAGLSVLKTVIKPLNAVPTWGNIGTFPGTNVSLFADVWYVDVDSRAPDDSTYHEWHLRLNRSLREIPGAIEYLDEGKYLWRFTEDFEGMLVSTLHEYGFRWPAPDYSDHSPTGKMFVDATLQASQYGRRVRVINHWQRDV